MRPRGTRGGPVYTKGTCEFTAVMTGVEANVVDQGVGWLADRKGRKEEDS